MRRRIERHRKSGDPAETLALQRPLEIQAKEGDPDTLTVRGYASVFGTLIDCYPPTIIHRGAFKKTLAENAGDVRVLWMHAFEEPVAIPTKMAEDATGLAVEFELSAAIVGAQNLARVRAGIIDAMSIGFDPIKFDFEEREDKAVIRHLRELRLWEFSLVTWGANRDARITSVQGAARAEEVLRAQLAQAVELRKLITGDLAAETVALMAQLGVPKAEPQTNADAGSQDRGATSPAGNEDQGAADEALAEVARIDAAEAEIRLESLRLGLGARP